MKQIILFVFTICFLNTKYTSAVRQFLSDQELSTSSSWRCGVFLAGRRFRLPLANYFVIPQQFKATCPAKFSHTRYNGVYANKCKELGAEWEGKWSALLSYPKGTRYGDQVCKIAAEQLGEDNIPSFRFPDGIQFGYYYNWCGSKLWRDSTGRSDVRVCCKDGFYKSCQEILEEMEAEAAAVEAQLLAEIEAEDAKVAAELGGGATSDKKGSKVGEKPSGSGTANGSSGAASTGSSEGSPGTASTGTSVGSPGTASTGTSVGSPGTASTGTSVGSPGTVSTGTSVGSLGTASTGTSEASPGTAVAEPSRVESLKSSLEQNKKLSDAEIAEVKKIISAYKASAEVLLKKAKELEVLLEKRKLI